MSGRGKKNILIRMYEKVTMKLITSYLKFLIKNILLSFHNLVMFWIYSKEGIIRQFSYWSQFIAKISQTGAAVMLSLGGTILWCHHYTWALFIVDRISLQAKEVL